MSKKREIVNPLSCSLNVTRVTFFENTLNTRKDDNPKKGTRLISEEVLPIQTPLFFPVESVSPHQDR